MISLEKISGLPIEVTKDYKLKFNPPLQDFPLTFARKFSEMSEVLMNPNVKSPSEETYFVYRGIHMPEHHDIMRDYKLTYDVTVVPPMMLGDEFNKTLGHYHAPKPGTNNIAHPEVYEVLHGEALFMLQKLDANSGELLSVLAIRAGTGEKVIYPPNYGHIMVNIGNDVLITANWLSMDYKPMYDPIKEKKGMAYYVVADEIEQFKFVANENYKDSPPVRMIDTRFMSKLAISANQPMYTTGANNPQSLDFLNNPEKYIMELAGITS
jgi:glucose-6-phosphate isomerase